MNDNDQNSNLQIIEESHDNPLNINTLDHSHQQQLEQL